MKKLILLGFISLIASSLFSQKTDSTQAVIDSLRYQLDEVVISLRRELSNYRQEKTLSSIDEYLEKSNLITMIKRGNYAWEPSINNMVTDRLNVTIDGMQIYGACTDKMDPVTSYVDVSNLDKVSISSGQEGTENANCIGGGLDMKLHDIRYKNLGLKTSFDLGYETNGDYRVTGANIEYSTSKYYFGVDGIYRKSSNYNAGVQQEILYSQFEKYNVSMQMGYKLSKKHSLEAFAIYDKASDVGYPALPMDVSLAEATILSLTHNYSNSAKKLYSIETKLYSNSIVHTMDDSKRPDVPIRMDMPGWSDTYGMYSKAKMKLGKHMLMLNLNSHFNRSVADMTMYPNDVNEMAMYMYTWPDVETRYAGIFLKDMLHITKNSSLTFTTRMGMHNNQINNKVGLESLKIYYPDMSSTKTRMLKSLSARYKLNKKNMIYSLGMGYGERAPSVSEAYGFYLFNSFDKYDYIGNPELKNEQSLEYNLSAVYSKDKLELGVEGAMFNISNYILGEDDPTLYAMTIGANGVRLYTALDDAMIISSSMTSKYELSKSFSVNASIGYNYGEGGDGEKLPLIRPISYYGELSYYTDKFTASLQIKGDGTQVRYSSMYGEDQTDAYSILNLKLGNVLSAKDNKVILKYGVENVLDKQYSTYADWNNIMRQGRNYFVNVSYIIK